MLDVARKYIARGWAVVPIPRGEKGPILKGWPELRIKDPEQWFSSDSNIGIIQGSASGLVCVDLDHPLAIELGPHFLPPTGLKSGRGASPLSHWFYKSTARAAKFKLPHDKNDQEKKLTVVELLGEGNQVVVGPSVHPSGDIYDILDGEAAEVDGEELTRAVKSLFAAVLDTLGVKELAPKGNGSGGSSSFPGQDYDQRGDVRGLLISHGWQPLYTAGVNEHWRRPGKTWGTSATLKDGRLFYVFTSSTGLEPDTCYGPFGLYSTLEHGGDFAAATRTLSTLGFGEQLATVDLSAILEDKDEDDELDEELSTIGQFPPSCLSPPGLLSAIVDYNLRTAKYPQPVLAVAGALALLATITGRKICDPAGTRPNLYIIGLGPTRSGKEHARWVNKRVLDAVGRHDMYEESLASNAALHGFLQRSPAALLMLDEFGDFLAASRAKFGGNTQASQIVASLNKLYSSSRGHYKASRYADNSKQIDIDQPHLTLYGTSTGGVFWRHVLNEHLHGGFFGRLAVFPEVGYVPPQSLIGVEQNPPPELLSAVSTWLDMVCGTGNLATSHPTPEVLPYEPAAQSRYEDHELKIDLRRRKEEPLRAAIWSGTGERTAKLALLFAASRGGAEITIEDVDLAILLSNHLSRGLVCMCGENVAENSSESATKRVYRMIKDAGRKGIAKNVLTRRTQWIPGRSRERLEIFRELVDGGLVLAIEDKSGSNRPKTVFTAACNLK